MGACKATKGSCASPASTRALASWIRTRSRSSSRDSWTRERQPLSLMSHRIDLTLARGLHEAAGHPMVLR
jgi:hypothetical protein